MQCPLPRYGKRARLAGERVFPFPCERGRPADRFKNRALRGNVQTPEIDAVAANKLTVKGLRKHAITACCQTTAEAEPHPLPIATFERFDVDPFLGDEKPFVK